MSEMLVQRPATRGRNLAVVVLWCLSDHLDNLRARRRGHIEGVFDLLIGGRREGCPAERARVSCADQELVEIRNTSLCCASFIIIGETGTDCLKMSTFSYRKMSLW